MEKIFLGIELGSTRIKAVLIDEKFNSISSGNYSWENKLINGMWTYSLDEIHKGIQKAYHALKIDFKNKYGKVLRHIDGIGVSAMMHGYLVFDENDQLLVPFRTWRNTTTKEASEILTSALNFNIPQRWSVAHLFQAILNKESHVSSIRFQTTLAGYVHYLLTNEKVIGIGDASGMFPINEDIHDYDTEMMNKFEKLCETYGNKIKICDIFPRVKCAGEYAGKLTQEGAYFLDYEHDLCSDIPFCPPEGDAGTGMVATNSVLPGTGNVSIGTSIFLMATLKDKLDKVYPEIDIVCTPVGNPVAMVHCNNGTSEINSWVNIFYEFIQKMNLNGSIGDIYTTLFNEAYRTNVDSGGVISCNYLSGEPITHFEQGVPFVMRNPEGTFTLGNFISSLIYSSLVTLKIGMNILTMKERVQLQKLYAHGGFFKTPVIGQKIVSSIFDVAVSILDNAGEGGAWGIAILAAYSNMGLGLSLSEFLENKVYKEIHNITEYPDTDIKKCFDDYMDKFEKSLNVEVSAIRCVNEREE